MNTSEVSKLLGVSHSTINRWITQLQLDINKTALGHYRFSEEDIALLQHVQTQLHNGALLQNVQLNEKTVRKATISPRQTVATEHKIIEQLQEKISDIEQRLNTKADEVVSYQLLQHRSDLNELQTLVEQITTRLEQLEVNMPAKSDTYLAFTETASTKKQKKKPFFKTIFGIS